MPRSRSRSFESITRSRTSWLARKTPLWRSRASTSVVLPWSTWAMMATLRSWFTGLLDWRLREPAILTRLARIPKRAARGFERLGRVEIDQAVGAGRHVDDPLR